MTQNASGISGVGAYGGGTAALNYNQRHQSIIEEEGYNSQRSADGEEGRTNTI